MSNIYGVLENGTHIDISKTERGAKQYATKHGYNEVSIRYSGGYMVRIIAEKINNKWVSINNKL